MTRYHVLHNLSSGFHGSHRGGIKLGGIRTFKAPVAIYTTVVIDKHCGVELQHAIHQVGILLTPVANLERTVGPVALGNQSVPATTLVIGEEIVGFLTRAVCHQGNIWGIQHICRSCRVEGLALGILVNHEDNPVVTPVVQTVNRSRPYHLISSTILILQVIVRTIDIDALLTRLIGILKHIGFSIGNMFPKGKVRITNSGQTRLCCLCLLTAG